MWRNREKRPELRKSRVNRQTDSGQTKHKTEHKRLTGKRKRKPVSLRKLTILLANGRIEEETKERSGEPVEALTEN